MRVKLFSLVAFLAIASVYLQPSRSETVVVKYRGPVDLKTFACGDISRSSFITRVCYDRAKEYMIIRLNSTYYHYCELPASLFNAFLEAPSMGAFYNQRIRGSGLDGPFDCRTHNMPDY
ncbi:KTSC domain-containing protein [Bradyrhizobium sp. 13971]